MKFTLSWLKEHLETEATLDEITEALTDLGLELEGIEDPGETLGAFSICRVIEAVQHPNADRLRLCRVETWPHGPDQPSEEVQVVCGAPNARTGLVGVFAPVGTHVPGTGVDLKPGVIRGVESNGMLCSERELEISEDHDGIIDLPADTPLGVRYIDWKGLNDPTIEIAITPNRPDALGVAGIARDLAARGLGTIITPEVAEIKGTFPSPLTVTIAPDVQEKGCPVFCGRLIRGVRNGPSPLWLQQRLKAIGLRPISALVDVTNYLTYDRNRPLHVFDADKVKGNLRVHWAEQGSTLMALDDKEYTFAPDMIMISDDEGPEAIAGVMGGLPTGCTEETVNVFIESAYWDPVTTASTGRRLKINSDARYRFERGADPASCPWGVDAGTQMILDLCGGEPSEMVVAGAVPDTARTYRLRPERVISLVGMDIPREEQVRILTDLGFVVNDPQAALIAAAALAPAPGLTLMSDAAASDLSVGVPSWRPDVLGEADLVEEVARVASLTKLVSKPLPRMAGVGRKTLTPMQTRERDARRTLAALGLNECVTYSFIGQEEAALFGGGDEAVRLDNPISSEMSHMRPSALPGLLAAAARNQAQGAGDVGLFEIGAGYHGGEPGEQTIMAAAIRVGATTERHWSGSRRAVDLYDAKADAEAVLAALGAPVGKLMVMRDASGWFHPGRSAALKLGPKNVLAHFGELHPKVLKAMDVKGSAVAITVMLENLPQSKAKSATRPALKISNLQRVERDFAFVVNAEVEAEAIVKAARAADKALIEGVAVFDVFEGRKAVEQLGDGRKSVAISVRMQPRGETLTEAEIEAISAEVIASVRTATGAELRG